MRILIADDHPIVRNGIKDIILDISTSYLVDEAKDTNEVVKMVISNHYDLIILDISMPGGGGISALKQIKQSKPGTKVIMLSMHDDEQYISRSLKAGATGYLTKAIASDELELAIKKVMVGEIYLGSDVVSKMTAFMYSDKEKAKHEQLSEREFQVFILIVKGYKTSEIAEEINISPKTVSTYRDRIVSKMRLSKNSELVQYALKNKLID